MWRRWLQVMLLVVSGAVFWLVVGVAAMWWWFAPYSDAESYVPGVARSGAPLVEALDRFFADNGRPPEQLSLLTPRYLAELPDSGFPRCEEFEYWVSQREGEWRWSLHVWCEPLASISIDADSISFDSEQRRWEYLNI
ncbi:MAG: hypothetical protein JNN27_20025 [Planctomycetes bacterium]|nr:hypothetical protein [Planctomycetota bacterium]